MKGGKLFKLLSTLTTQEFKDLKKVVQSPIFNTNNRLIPLYEGLKNQFPNFDTSQKGKENLFKKVFPKEPFNNYKIHRVFTQFTQLTEEFLLLVNQRKNEINRRQQLLTIYMERNLLAFFENEAKIIEEKISEITVQDLEYFEAKIHLNKAKYFHPQKNRYDKNDDSLDELVESLDSYFALSKMRFGISQKSREQILGQPANWRFFEAIYSENEQDFLQYSPLSQLYQLAFQLLKESTKATNFVIFENYERLLFANIENFRIDAKTLFFCGLNFINRQVNRGNSEFSKKAFQWYQLGLQHQLLIDKGQMSDITFGNVVVFACREKAFDWANDFIQTHAKFLAENHRQDMLIYHTALCSFFQGNFNETYTTLINYNFPNTYFLKFRFLAIRAIFETFLLNDNYYDLLTHQINAFKQGIRRNKIFTKASMESTLNTLHIIQLFAKKMNGFEKKHAIKNQLLAEIQIRKNIAGKAWLLEKVNTL